MNKRTNRSPLIAGLTALFLAGNLAAQNPLPDQAGKVDRREGLKELREQYRSWAHAEIFPKLAEWKAVLDEAMTPEDLAILNDLRRQAKALRSEIRESAAGMRTAWRQEDYDALKTYRARLTEAKKQMLDLLDLLTPLAIEYRTTLEEIGKEAKPHVEAWRVKGKEIWETWKAGHEEDAGRGVEWFLKKRGVLSGLLSPELQQGMRLARFMLWDGNADLDEGADVDAPDLE